MIIYENSIRVFRHPIVKFRRVKDKQIIFRDKKGSGPRCVAPWNSN